MTIQSVQNHAAFAANYARQCLPTPNQLARGCQKVALPAIALAAASSLPGAEAIGTIGCVICLAAGGGPACIPICVVALVTIPAQMG